MDTKEYLEKFKSCFDIYNSLKKYLPYDSVFDEYIENKKYIIPKLENPEFPVAFIGQFSAGKSVVVNALIGRYLLPENTKSTTAVPTIIKKSDNGEEYFKVYYLDSKGKNELKDLYIEEIVKGFSNSISEKIDINVLKDSDKNILISKIESYIKEDVNKSFSGGNLFEELKKLISKWSNEKDQNIEIVDNLNDLSNYIVENDNSNIILVDRVEIFLKDLNISEKMVIVDLPGVGVINPRHKKITENYVKNDAKAFVSVGKANNLIEGEEKNLYDKINSLDQSVFSRAFWLINQWDNLSEQQKKEEKDNFINKTKYFSIDDNKVFPVSGLFFLLLEKIKKKELDKEENKNLKKHIDLVKKIDINIESSEKEIDMKIQEIDYLRNFLNFRESLFEYLNTKCEKDFMIEIEKELKTLVEKIKNKIPDDRNANLEDIKIKKLVSITNKITNGYLNQAKEKINNHFSDIKNNGNSFTNKFDIKPTLDIFDSKMASLDKNEIKKYMTEGKFINKISIKLPNYLQEKFKVGDILEKNLVNFVKDNINIPISSIKDKLLKNNLEYLSKEIKYFLESQSKRDSEMRAKGVSDVLLINYGNELNNILTTLTIGNHVVIPANKVAAPAFAFANPPTPMITDDIDKEITNGLEKFSVQMKKYIDEEWCSLLQNYLDTMVKNYYYDLKTELIEIFEKPDPILEDIINEEAKKTIDSELESESRKILVLKESYNKLDKIFIEIINKVKPNENNTF